MYYFVFYFTCYVLGILTCLYISYKVALLLSVLAFIIGFIISRKFFANILIILFTFLACLSIYYNSKSVVVQYLNNSVDITMKVLGEDISAEDEKTEAQQNDENTKNKDDNRNITKKTSSDYNKYEVCITNLNGKEINEKSIIFIKKRYEIEENCIYKISADVSDIQSNKNFMLFNYKDYLKTKKIYTTLFANNTPELIEKDYSAVNAVKIKCKAFIEGLFYKYMSKENASIILSIILGDKDYLDDEFYSDIQKSGLAHIFAVSGLHIAILYSVFLKIFCFCGLNKRAAWVVTWLLLWLYGFLIGFPISVLRSLLMFTFVFMADLLYRKYNTVNSIVISALILLMYNPFYLFDAGFQLSFAAAFTLIIYNKYIASHIKTKNSLLSSIILYITIQVFTYPILSYYFNYISSIGLIYNLLMVPVFSFLTVFSFISIIIGFVSQYTVVIPLMLVDWLLNIIAFYIEKGSGLDIAGIIVPSLSIFKCSFYYIAVFLAIFTISDQRKISKQIYFYAFAAFFFTNFIIIPRCFRGIELRVADVGQGLFCVLGDGQEKLIFDAGSTAEGIGEYVCAPYIIKNGMRNISSIFISHWHSDHYSGINEILKKCHDSKAINIYSSNDDTEGIISSKVNVIKTGKKIDFGSFKIDTLWPDKGYKSDNENNMSNVFLVVCDNIRILFAGDIEMDVEKELIAKLPQTDILIVPHHGSKSSSSYEFVKKINPKIGIMSYGKNSYGIPSENIIDIYKENGTELLSTFIDGEINIMVINNKIYYNTYIGNKSDNYTDIYYTYLLYNSVVFILIFITALLSSKILLYRFESGKIPK